MTKTEKLLQYLRKIFLSRGILLCRTTNFNRLQNLAEKLWPTKTEFNLIRVGGGKGGGYLVPNDLEGIEACFSPGVSDTATFEIQIKEQFGIGSILADYSVDSAPSNFQPISFTKKFIGAIDNGKYMSFESWMKNELNQNSGKDLILQMDIEGGEYEAIIALPEDLLTKFRIIVIEIHSIPSWADPHLFSIVEVFFAKLLKSFYVVHNHPTNALPLVRIGNFLAPTTFELTFLRKDRTANLGFIEEFPHQYDKPCVPEIPELVLPGNWYVSRNL